MKKIFLIIAISFTFFNFSSCEETLIVGDICDITTEICYYAQSICGIFPKNVEALDSPEEIKYSIHNAKNSLMKLHTELRTLNKSLTSENKQEYLEELHLVREQLKALHDRLQKSSIKLDKRE